MSSAKSLLGLLDNIVRCVELKVVRGKFCCLEHRRKVGALCLLYEIYDRADQHLHQYLDQFVASHNTRASAAVAIPRYRNNQFSRSFCLLLCVCEIYLANLISYKSAMY